jgi:hypothetical protein
MNRGRSTRLLVVAAGLVASLSSSAASAGPGVELCQLAGNNKDAVLTMKAWNELDSDMDAKYAWWRNATPEGCIRVI